jgi:hypothetical protein
VQRTMAHEHGETVIQVQSPSDGVVRLVLSPRVRRLLPLESRRGCDGGRYLVPASSSFVKVKGELMPATSMEEAKLVEMKAKHDSGPRRVSLLEGASDHQDGGPEACLPRRRDRGPAHEPPYS